MKKAVKKKVGAGPKIPEPKSKVIFKEEVKSVHSKPQPKKFPAKVPAKPVKSPAKAKSRKQEEEDEDDGGADDYDMPG